MSWSSSSGRAFICDGVCRIFDANADGTLSYAEFLAVMSDRLHRGLKVNASSRTSVLQGKLKHAYGLKPFKQCVFNELSHS